MDNNYIFTTCGAYGRNGPTQSQINEAYPVGHPLHGYVISNNGIQSWIVPTDGTYTIIAKGAQGGTGVSYPYRGGYGAIMSGTFKLDGGTILKILVGQMGCGYSHEGGGGGGSFVAKVDPLSPYTFNQTGEKVTPLIVAGGGGGGSYSSSIGMEASLSINGTNGTVPGSGAGGINGNGGYAAANGDASAGGGFITNGYQNGHGGNDYPGISFLNGGTGGSSAYGDIPISGCGGFGGGGGTHGAGWGGGGGGGYSGGSTSQSSCFGGGGGGSYNAGTTKYEAIGNIGHGVVIIIKGISKTESFSFTNCGATGRYGPSQLQVDNAYVGTNLSGKVISENGIQIWTVPSTCLYLIEAWGARSGTQPEYGIGNVGAGRVIRGLIKLNANQKIKILAGQCGSDAGSDFTAGGGGGTFIATYENKPLVVAGGGGAVSSDCNGGPAQDSVVTPNNKNAGNGYNSPSVFGGGGGGFYSDGNASFTDGYGRGFVNGGVGGWANSGCGVGGFGGGAGATDEQGAGGGGYTGGCPFDSPASEGGGSFVTQDALVLDYKGGLCYEAGKVTITMVFNSSIYLVKKDDKLYIPAKEFYDELTDSFNYFTEGDLSNNFSNFINNGLLYSNNLVDLFAPFKLYDANGISYKTINPIKYFDMKSIKISILNAYEIDASNAIRINYKVNQNTLINKCQIKIKDDIKILDNVYDRHFVINSAKSIMTMIEKVGKYYNKDLKEDDLNNILITGIPNNNIENYNIEENIFNLSIAFNDNIYNADDKLKEIKLIAKTGNNYRKLMYGEVIIANNQDKIFVKFKDTSNEVIINALHKNPSCEEFINTLEEF